MRKNKGVWLVVLALFLSGCATEKLNPNFAVQMEAYASIERAKIEAAKEVSRSNQARFLAIQEIARAGNSNTKAMAVMALAVNGGNAVAAAPEHPTQVPQIPESESDKAYKWTALFAGPVTNIASAWFGYSLGKVQSNNAANTTIAGYQTFGNIATQGFASNALIAGHIQAPQPNITLSGGGVIGNGTYTGAYSGPNSGNSGVLGDSNRNQSPNTPTTTNNNCSTSTC